MSGIDPLTTIIPPSEPNGPGAWIYWIMSTWVPYRVVLMRTAVSYAGQSGSETFERTVRLERIRQFDPGACLGAREKSWSALARKASRALQKPRSEEG